MAKSPWKKVNGKWVLVVGGTDRNSDWIKRLRGGKAKKEDLTAHAEVAKRIREGK